MNWLDNYINVHETGYMVNEYGSLFVEIDSEFVRPVSDDERQRGLKEITKDEFLGILMEESE